MTAATALLDPRWQDPLLREARRDALRAFSLHCEACLAALRAGTATWGGLLHVIVARCGVVDGHGDLVVRGALPRPVRARVSADRHEAWDNARVAVGTAWCVEVDDVVVAAVRFDATRWNRWIRSCC